MKPVRFWIAVLLTTEILGLLRIYLSLSHSGVLPAPFFYDASDSFMDFFNTNFWALRDGRYETWKSIYPIFTFMLAKLVTSADCAIIPLGPYELRGCAASDIAYILAAYIVGALCCAVISSREYEKYSGVKSRWLAFITFTTVFLAMPGLFALERGNYILVALAFLSLGVLFRNDWRAAFCLAVAISLKQYLVVLLFPALVKKRFDYIWLTVVFVAILNCVAFLYIEERHFYLILENMIGFSSGTDIGFFEKMWYPTSFSAWARVLDNSLYLEQYFSLRQVLVLRDSVAMGRLVGLMISGAAVLMVFRVAPLLSWEYISFLMLTVVVLLFDSVGGYSLILVAPYVIVVIYHDRFYGDAVRFPFLLFIVFSLFTPLDFVVGPSKSFSYAGFISGRVVEYVTGITAGAYVRPFVVFALICAHLTFLVRCRKKLISDEFGKRACICR